MYSYGSVLYFDTYCFLRRFFEFYLPFGFQFLAWDHLYIIYCLPCFLSMGLLLSPPKTFLNVRWMEPQNSIPDLLILSYFTGITGDFNVSITIQENYLLEEISSDSNNKIQSNTQRSQLIQNSDDFHATKSLRLLLKSNKI